MKLHQFSTVLATSLALFAFACAAPADDAAADDGAQAAQAEDLTAAHSILAGTYSEQEDSGNATSFFAITLKDDHAFSARGGCRPNPNGPSCQAILLMNGTWSLQTTAGKPHLVLTDSFGQVTSYLYSFTSDVLVLKKSAHAASSKFDKDLSHLPKVHAMDKCADKFDNTVGFCPDNFACLEDTTESPQNGDAISRCLPPNLICARQRCGLCPLGRGPRAG